MNPVVDIILDGKIFGMRTWTIIPRIGEIVLLKNGEVWAKVKQVVWGNDSKAPPGVERQWIQLLCETIDPTSL